MSLPLTLAACGEWLAHTLLSGSRRPPVVHPCPDPSDSGVVTRHLRRPRDLRLADDVRLESEPGQDTFATGPRTRRLGPSAW